MIHSSDIKLFSVPVWGFLLNDHKYQSLDYIKVIEDLEKTQPSTKKSNFGGYQTHDNLNNIPVFFEFVSIIENIAKTCIGEVKMSNMWANINYKNCYNGEHTHSGALSGVFYLQTPKNCGNLVLCNPAVRSDGHYLRVPNYVIEPQKLALIFFPSWLSHYVEQNLNDDKRISISFNLEKVRT